jgi:hypothetical protein
MIPASEPQPRLDSLGQPLLEDTGEVDWFAPWDCLQMTPYERLQAFEQLLEMSYELEAAGRRYRLREGIADVVSTDVEASGVDLAAES